MNDGAARHFAVRQVNPFEGVLQVVERDDARAYSADGKHSETKLINDLNAIGRIQLPTPLSANVDAHAPPPAAISTLG